MRFAEELAQRRESVRRRVGDAAILLPAAPHAVRSNDTHYTYRQDSDFYYLTGLKEAGTVLVLNGTTKNAAVFAVKRPEFGGPTLEPQLRDIEDAQDRYGITVLPMESFYTFLSFAGNNAAVKKLYLQLTPPDAQIHARFETQLFAAQALDHPVFGQPQPYAVAIERIRQAESHLDAADVSPLLDELRWVKTPYEIERLRRRYASFLREIPGTRALDAHWTASFRALRWHVVLEGEVLEPDIDVEILPEALVVRARVDTPEEMLLGVLPVPPEFDARHPEVRYEVDHLEILLVRVEGGTRA